MRVAADQRDQISYLDLKAMGESIVPEEMDGDMTYNEELLYALNEELPSSVLNGDVENTMRRTCLTNLPFLDDNYEFDDDPMPLFGSLETFSVLDDGISERNQEQPGTSGTQTFANGQQFTVQEQPAASVEYVNSGTSYNNQFLTGDHDANRIQNAQPKITLSPPFCLTYRPPQQIISHTIFFQPVVLTVVIRTTTFILGRSIPAASTQIPSSSFQPIPGPSSVHLPAQAGPPLVVSGASAPKQQPSNSVQANQTSISDLEKRRVHRCTYERCNKKYTTKSHLRVHQRNHAVTSP